MNEVVARTLDLAAAGATGALLATGVALVSSVRRLLPLQLAGIAALAGAVTHVLWTHWPAHPWLAFATAAVGSVPVALGMDVLVDRPLRRRPATDALLASAGGLALLVGVATNIFEPREALPGPRHLDVITCVLGVLLLCGLLLATKYLKLGLAMRAVGYHPDTAALMGINPDRIILWSVAIGSVLIATAGGLWSLHHSPHYQNVLLLQPVVIGLAGAVIGGTRQLRRPTLAGAVIGGLDAAASLRWPESLPIRLAVPLVCLIFFFLVRPPERVSIDAAEPA